MWNTEKKINKWLIWLVIWTTIVWWLSTTKKWQEVSKSTASKLLDKAKGFLEFFKSWVDWLKSSIKKTSKDNGGPGAFMWIGGLLIPIIYRSLFGKKDDNNNQGSNKDVTTLNKKWYQTITKS